MGAGGNGNNQQEWEGNGYKARLNLGLGMGMGMSHREWQGMRLEKTFPLISNLYHTRLQRYVRESFNSVAVFYVTSVTGGPVSGQKDQRSNTLGYDKIRHKMA